MRLLGLSLEAPLKTVQHREEVFHMRITKKVQVITGVAVLAMISSLPIVPAHAADGSCAEDAKKFCGGLQPGGGRIAQCLTQHEAELSAACRDSLQTMKTRSQETMQACSNDVRTLCKGVQPGGGRIAQCLKQHEVELSEPCKKAMQPSPPVSEQ
jgi:hypothetical protein